MHSLLRPSWRYTFHAAMPSRRKKNHHSSANSQSAQESLSRSVNLNRISRKKLWLFRILALVLVPIFFFGMLEGLLRLVGFGYPTTFLLPSKQAGQQVFTQNNQFGWRFFGPEVARWPYPFSITRSKPTNTVRIFVFGESAARGEPQPEFGLARMLQTLLSQKHPGVQFEVVNTAMTAINSHTIRSIAQDCSKADGDIWVVYMGNNEVVGPFGAGTVFGSQSPPLPLIRGSLALKGCRTGQFLDAASHWLQKNSRDDTVWGGMTQFLGQQVQADDPRMNGVYHHFENNLADIIQLGRNSGVGIVVSTVAVNLKDCAPFASAHRSSLSATDKLEWERLYQLGSTAQDAGNFQEAAVSFKEANRIDETYAELRFRQGQCLLARGETNEARQHFEAARDLDTLRFRCDGKLNEIIRQTTTNRNDARVLLADAERVFANQSPAALPGEEFFYEHVHLLFPGNYLLARTLAEQVEKLLPERVTTRQQAGEPWPSASDCARQLAHTDLDQATAWNSIIATMSDPPFTGQLHHDAQMRRLEAALGKLAPALQPNGIREALRRCEAALATAPDDAALQKKLAILKKAGGDWAGAAEASRRELELLPSDSEGWTLLGSILAQQQQLEEAARAFRRGFQLGPQGIKSSLDLAGSLAALGKPDEAIREYQRILAKKPRCMPALLQLGQVVEKLGRKAEAESYFRQALTNRSQRLPELLELGGFFQNRGAFTAAVEVYQDAIKLNPTDALPQLAAGRCLASLGRFEDAAPFTAEAVRLAPEFVEAHLMHGIVLWRRGMIMPAKEQFEIALKLRPDSLDARVNLGMAFAQLQRRTEALALFEEVLLRNPTNAVAQKYVQSLRGSPEAHADPTNRATPP